MDKRKKTKVAQVVTRLEFGGVESILLNYICHLDKEKFEFHIITQDINADDCIRLFVEAGVFVHIVTHKRKSIIKNILEILRLMKNEKFDIVHSHMTLMNFYVLSLAWLTGTKVRISHSHNAFIANNIKQKVCWDILKTFNRIVSNVWVTCGYEAGAFLFGANAMKNGKVYFMNNAIDTAKFEFNSDTRHKIRVQYGINDEICVGHVGRFMEQKNHKYVLDVFDELLKIHADAKLMLVGIGELEEVIRSYAKVLKIDDKVIFVGSVTNTYDYYQAMDVFVLPSLYEGLPVVSIEAQVSDLPCIISENVDKRCAMTQNVSFLPVNISPQVWSSKILNVCGGRRSTDVIQNIKEAHYDIYTEANELCDLYLRKLKY